MSVDKDIRNKHEEPLRLLVMAASARTGSLNVKLARLASEVLTKKGAIAEFRSINDFDCPSFNHDVEKTSGIPPGAQRLNNAILENDAFIIVSPEYNGSMPGTLKNIIDWVSRFRPQPFNEKHLADVCFTFDGGWQPRAVVSADSARTPRHESIPQYVFAGCSAPGVYLRRPP